MCWFLCIFLTHSLKCRQFVVQLFITKHFCFVSFVSGGNELNLFCIIIHCPVFFSALKQEMTWNNFYKNSPFYFVHPFRHFRKLSIHLQRHTNILDYRKILCNIKSYFQKKFFLRNSLVHLKVSQCYSFINKNVSYLLYESTSTCFYDSHLYIIICFLYVNLRARPWLE